MDLRPTHLGYAYQDLLTAIRLVDVALGLATEVVVDTKRFQEDRFDDLTTVWRSGRRGRLQIKHTANERELAAGSFTGDRRGLRLDKILGSVLEDLRDYPGSSYGLVLRDRPPEDDDLAAVLRPIERERDPGPALPGLSSTRMRFDASALRDATKWQSMLAELDNTALRSACDALVVDVGTPECSLDVRDPGPAEDALLRRVADELGAGRPPNQPRSPQDVALALIEAAKAARSREGTVTASTLVPRLDLAVDFGAVYAGHPVDPTVEIARPAMLGNLTQTVTTSADHGSPVILTGGPGSGKSWLCEQLADQLRGEWIVARHHCWLGKTDPWWERRVLDEVVIGSLLGQLEEAAPDVVAELRPRYAATPEALQQAVDAVRRAHPTVPVVLIVDGLDHVTRVRGRVEGAAFASSQDPAATLVDTLASVALPHGVALLIASQPGEHLQPLWAHGPTVGVPPLSPQEIRELAERIGVLAAFPRTLDDTEPDRADATMRLVHERSGGNALYATYLCRQAVGPKQSLIGDTPPPNSTADPLERLRDVPASADDLDAYYDYLLDGLTPAQRLAVNLLAVCDFAITATELHEIFPVVGAMLPAALATVAPVVVQAPGAGGLRIHHESFSRFVRERHDQPSLRPVQAAAAAWLSGRGFFTDARAFRHLPELLIALERDDELTALIGPEFLTEAIAGLQPPRAVAHVIDLLARRAASRQDWPTLVRLVQLRNAADSYEKDGLSEAIADHTDVLIGLLGAGPVAAGLAYDTRPTFPLRWGLRLCAAVDAAGAAAPWGIYLDAWDDPSRDHDGFDRGLGNDDELTLAVQRGRLRVRQADADDHEAAREIVDDGVEDTPAQCLAAHLADERLPPLPRLLDVFIDCLGPAPVLQSARLIDNPQRRAEVLLHLADNATIAGMPTPRELAAEACASSPGTDPRGMLRHGVPASDLAGVVLGPNVERGTRNITAEVLREHVAHRPDVVEHWLTAITLAHHLDPQAPTRLLPALEGAGFYRAWLRFAVTTVGLGRGVDAGAVTARGASSAVRVALERLAAAAQPFEGRPRACDLYSLHDEIQGVLLDAVALVGAADLESVVESLTTISTGTTTFLNGSDPSGPLTATALVALLNQAVGPASATSVRQLTKGLRRSEIDSGTPYPELAAFELEMARVSLAGGDLDETRECWRRAARYLGSYGSHKDPTIHEVLDPLSDLAAVDLEGARARLARLRPLTRRVRRHTDGRGTRQVPVQWWERLADLDPAAAADLAAEILLAEPGLEDGRAAAAHRELLRSGAAKADPVVLAALRVAAGAEGNDVEADTALLGRLGELADDDRAHAAGILPILANAICATYDDQPLIYAPDAQESAADHALRRAAQRLGGDGAPPRQPRPEPGSGLPRTRAQSLPTILHAAQRPELPQGAAGALLAVRDHSAKRYDDDPAAPRWASDALTSAIGWRLLDVTGESGSQAAASLLHRVVHESGVLGDTAVLADVAAGLDLRRHHAPEVLPKLASAAYTLAYTTIRGGGGWRNFAGRDRAELWRRAVELDADTARTVLAGQVYAVLEDPRRGTHGVTQGVITAFTAQDPEPREPGAAFSCWDAACDVIEHRLPGSLFCDRVADYDPADEPVRPEVDVALARLAMASFAQPSRDDRRRALLAATVLLAARPSLAQTAIAPILAADLGAAPLTWLLTMVQDNLHGDELTDEFAVQMTRLARSDLLSVRVLAARILGEAGRPEPDAPATSAHSILRRAVADALRDELA